MNTQELVARIRDLRKAGHLHVDLKPYASALERAEFPLVAPGRTLFVLPTKSTCASLVGDMNGWRTAADPMHVVPFEPLFVLEKEFHDQARFDYKFVVNGEWILDPLNPRTQSSGLGLNSELRMGRYAEAPEWAGAGPGHAGHTRSFTLDSRALGGRQKVLVHTPVAYDLDKTRRFPTIYLLDGEDYQGLAHCCEIFDYAFHRKLLPESIVVLSVPGNRFREYRRFPPFHRHLADELIPEIDGSFRTINAPEARTFIGDSLGGLAVVEFAAKRPDLAGRVLAQSAAIAMAPSVLDDLAAMKKIPVRYSLDCGTYETSVGGLDFLAGVRALKELLQKRATEVTYREVPEGHAWASWKALLLPGLRALFPDGRL